MLELEEQNVADCYCQWRLVLCCHYVCCPSWRRSLKKWSNTERTEKQCGNVIGGWCFVAIFVYVTLYG
jgi:hypothetical protein